MGIEGYKPSEEKVKATEEAMSPEQSDLNETREFLLAKLKSESGLDSETFDEMVASFKFEGDQEMQKQVSSFRVDEHDYYAVTFWNAEKREESFREIMVDGKFMGENEAESFKAKYRKVIIGLMHINKGSIKDSSLS